MNGFRQRGVRWLAAFSFLLVLALPGRPAAGQPSLATEPLTASGQYQASFVADRGHVSVIALSGSYDRDLPGGGLNVEARSVVARELYRVHPDDYDFLVVFSAFPFNAGQDGLGSDAKAFHIGIRNDVQGIGLPVFDNSASFGSAGRLRGYIDMAALAGYATDPLAPGFEDTLLVLGHEVLHQWSGRVRFRQADGTLSNALLGRNGAHWSFLLDSDASVLYGNEWTDNGDGTFTSAGRLKFWSPLDLYLAGFLAPDEVQPFVLIDSPGTDPNRLPETGVTVTGEARTVYIEDVIAAEGPRVPAAADAPHELRAAFIFLTRPGQETAPEDLAGLERIRRAFETRFSILTGGRGLLRVHPVGEPAGEPGAPEPVDPGTAGTGTVNVNQALTWLRGRQVPAVDLTDRRGYWEDTGSTRSRDTAEALATLVALDPAFLPADRSRAVNWLAGRAGVNTDEVARLAAVLSSSAAGNPAPGSPVDTAATALRSRLRGLQNADGGWGLSAGYGSDPLDTSLAVLALAGRGDTPATALDKAAVYLLARQNADGGWSNVSGGASRTSVTAAALRALKAAARQDPAALDRALAWLAGKQNADGGFGDSPSTAHDTATVLQAAIELGAASRVRAGGAVDYLSTRQTAQGSWEGSAYTTSIVLSALRRFSFPNWRFAGAAQASPARPRDGERVAVTVTVINDGNAATPAGVLRLYEGDPDAGGTAAGHDVSIPPLAPGHSAVLTIDWDSLDKPGPRTLTAALDPDGAVAELAEADNRLSLAVEVQPAPNGAELEIRSGDITITPAQPAGLPAELGITAVVRNLGHADAGAVHVRLWRGETGTGQQIGEVTVSLPGRSSAAANFVTTLTAPGTTLYSVQVDPDNAVTGEDEGNNVAAGTVSTAPSLDLAVGESDLHLTGAAYLGRDATFEFTVRNRGTQSSPAARVALTVTDGTTTRTLPDRQVLLAGGQSQALTVTWRVDLTGALRFGVDVDADHQVEEADETNNSASLAFTAAEAQSPDLTVSYQDLRFDPDPARVGAPVTISAEVRNTGGQEAGPVAVAFFDGDPALGVRIGAVQTVPSLAAGAAATVSVVFGPLADAADHLIYVVVDPDNTIAELNEDDNRAFRTLSASTLPDLAVSASALQMAPPLPRPGEAVTVTVDVANLGRQEAQGVIVRLTRGGTPVAPDQTLAAVPGGAVARASFAWTFPAEGGTVRLRAEVDPQGAVQESSTANNAAERDFTALDPSQPVQPRYFSPDGDGVQDTAVFTFGTSVTGSPAVAVLDSRGRTVRRSAADPAAGLFTWDGRDDLGRVVRDGDYAFHLVDAAGNLLQEAPVTVDTDHSPLFAALGTPYEKITDLTCAAAPADNLQIPGDQSDAYFAVDGFTDWDGYQGSGIYRVSAGGPPPFEKIIGAGNFGGFRVSRDGKKIAYSTFLANADGSGAQPVLTSSSSYYGYGFRGPTSDLVYIRGSNPFGNDVATVHVRSANGTDRVVASSPQGSGFIIFSPFVQSDYTDTISPDGRFMIFNTCILAAWWDGCTRPYLMVDLVAGTQTELPLTSGFSPAWAPDSSKVAILRSVEHDDGERIETLIFDNQGHLLRTVPAPADPLADLPVYRAALGPVGRQTYYVEASESIGPSWSSSSDELALGLRYFEESDEHFAIFGRVLRINALTGSVETVGWMAPDFFPYSYHVSTWDGSAWVERGVLHYGELYAEQKLDLSPYLPDPQGDYKVRLRQTGLDAAHVDRVALLAGPAGDVRLAPAGAVRLPGEDVLGQVARVDSEVLDLHEREMEVRWTGLPEGSRRLSLALVAREEKLDRNRTRPFAYPAEADRFYEVRLAEDGSMTGAMTVDGLQTGADGLGDPLFTEWSFPDTGHPAAEVLGFAKSDATHLYASLDFTVDNTLDGGRDWASLWVRTPSGWKEFRVTTADSSRGIAGFTRTGRVSYTHKYYEFAIPLAEIGAQPGDTVALRFQAYGTAALSDEAGDFLPNEPDGLFWVPGESTLFYYQNFSGSTWIIAMDEGNRTQRVLAPFTKLADGYFIPGGNKLVFYDGRDIRDPRSDCYNPSGESSAFSFESRANLIAQLTGRASEDGRSILLEGTAADLHFASWRLEYAREDVPEFWTPLGPPVAQQVFDGAFTSWIPPQAGAFLVRLTVEDLAGNRRSVVRRFATGAAGGGSITDVSLSARLLSPNGDGVLDTATLHYRVLQPVHIDIRVRNGRGDVVRSYHRDHDAAGAAFDLVWDGRDDRGLPVPDGGYRFELQGFGFDLAVDTVPPAVAAVVVGPRSSHRDDVLQLAVVDVLPGLRGCAEDAHPGSARWETGDGAAPVTWREIGASLVCSPTLPPAPLSIEQFVNRSFRLVAVDAAGNRAVVTRPPGGEELILDGFAAQPIGPRGDLGKVPVSAMLPAAVEAAPLRFGLAETIVPVLSSVKVQYRQYPADGGSQLPAWSEEPPTQLLDADSGLPATTVPAPRFEVLWNAGPLQPGLSTEIRIAALDLLGRTHVSNSIRFQTAGGIRYLKILQQQGAPGSDLAKALAAAGLSPDRDRVLWATETVAEPLTGVALVLSSTDDPRFAGGKPLPLAGSFGSILLFDGKDLAPCRSYRGFVLARTVPQEGGSARTVQSAVESTEVGCLSVGAKLVALEPACGATPPVLRTAELTPESHREVELRLLSLAVTRPDNVIFSVNRPQSGQLYSAEIDTRDLAEGAHALYVRLTDGNGGEESRRLREVLIVDRSAPQVAITYPAEGQRLCGIQRDGIPVVDVEGTIDDQGGFSWSLTADGSLFGKEDLIPPYSPAGQLLPLTHVRKSGRLGTVAGVSGTVSLRLTAADGGGQAVCAERSFLFDSRVDGVSAVSDRQIISPNGDGTDDRAQISYSAGEPGRATVRVFRGERPEGTLAVVPVGGPLRALVTDQALVGNSTVPWDGLLDGGVPAGDGFYVVIVQVTDGCGNTGSAQLAVEVDTTPPDVALLAPAAGPLTRMLTAVVGSVSDLHLQDYRVEFGIGAQPAVWAPLASGAGERSQETLAQWNTYGLEGTHVLRLSARDRVGNTAQALVTVDIPTRDALVSDLEVVPDLVSPNGDGRRDAAAVRFGLTAEARITLQVVNGSGAAVRTLLDDAVRPAGAAVQPWDGRDDAGQAVADGAYLVRLHAVSTAAPSREQQEEVQARVDRTAPIVQIDRPRQGFASAEGGIVGTIQDANLSEYVISLADDPGAPVWSELSRGTASRQNAQLAPLTGRSEGDYALRIEARDGAENRTEQVVPFQIDNTPPRVRLTAPAAGAVVGGAGAVEVRGAVEEENPFAWRLELGAGESPASWSTLASGSGLPPAETLARWSAAGLSDGPYTLRLVAEDKAGLTAEAKVRVEVDNTPPAAALATPAEGGFVTAPLAITGTASDAHLLQYRIELAPTGGQGSEIGRGAVSVTAGTLLDWRALPPDGSYRLRLLVEDRTGNRAESSVQVTVDRRAPAAPQGLTAAVEGHLAGRLQWQANSEPDLAGYHVYRDGARLTAQPVAAPTYLDAALPQGTFVYTVTAVDRAGLESPPSAPATLVADETAPAPAIHQPLAGSAVSGVVDVRITAFSDDFKEYRLSVFPEGAPAAAILLRRSPVPVQSEAVAQWPTAGLAEGARFTLRLEAEDVRGNVGTVDSTVTIDNQAPSTPTGLTAAATDDRVDLSWTANPAADQVLGYLLYRDGLLVNGPAGATGDLRRYALASTSYADTGLADGTYRYTVVAIDAGGNVSAPSAPATATIERRAPHAVITVPADGSSIDRTVYILATTPDRDVSQVQLQLQAEAASTWTDIGAADTQAPWDGSWDPIALPYGRYRLRAVATDSGGRVDPAPSFITVKHTDLTRPQQVPSLTARVDGGAVQLAWSAVSEPDLAGYHVDRVNALGNPVRITSAPLAGTGFTDTDVPDGAYSYTVVAVDTYDNESDPSPSAAAKVYTPELARPFTPIRSLTTALSGLVEPGVQVEVSAGGTPLPAVSADAKGAFALASVPLVRGANSISVRATDAAGNRSKAAVVTVVSAASPSAPTGLTATVDNQDVQLQWNQNPEAPPIRYRAFLEGETLLADEVVRPASPLVTASSFRLGASPNRAYDSSNGTYWTADVADDEPDAGQWLAIRWDGEPILLSAVTLRWDTAVDYDIEVWDGGGWLQVAQVRGNTDRIDEVELPEPYFTTGVRVVMRSGTGEIWLYNVALTARPLIDGTTFQDYSQDGVHRYTVTAVDGNGFESLPSAPALAEVGNFEPPPPVHLEATVAGTNAVHLTWSASDAADLYAYRILRDGAQIGWLYAEGLTDLSYDDTGLANGTYRYIVEAQDTAGNSSPSNEAVATIAAPVLPAPVSLTVTVVPAGRALDLAWQPAAGSAPAGYRVLRSTVAGGPYGEGNEIARTSTTVWRDRGLTNGTTYFYVVEALDDVPNASLPSNEAHGVPADQQAPAVVLHFPGFPGVPYRTQESAVNVVGTTEPGAAVTLFRDGTAAGQATASSTAVTDPPVSSRSWIMPRLSPDGSLLWLDDGYSHEIFRFAGGQRADVNSVHDTVRWYAAGDRVAFPDYDSNTGATLLRSYRLADGGVETLATVDQAYVVLPAPDGRRLAFVGEAAGLSGLLVHDPATGAFTQLDDAQTWSFDTESLAWSPDGARLAYYRGSSDDLAVAELAQPGTVQVVESGPAGSALSWSPDGRSLLYTVYVDGWQQVRVFHPADGTTEDLTSDEANHDLPVWSPDGRALAFVASAYGQPVRVLVHSLDGEETEVFQNEAGINGLSWSRGGYLLISTGNTKLRVLPPGLFTLRGVGVHAGDNALTGSAVDTAGNTGPVSVPMVVIVPAGDLPNLAVTAADLTVLPAVPVLGQKLTLTATVRNLGAAAAPASDLSLALVKPDGTSVLLADRATVASLAPQGAATISRELTLTADPGSYQLVAVADPLDLLFEGDENDNRAERPFVVASQAGPVLQIATDRTSYAAGQDVLLSADVVNGGPAFTGRLELSIEDTEGFLVEALPASDITGLPYGQTASRRVTWSSGSVFAGSYRVHARLLNALGSLAAEATAPFAIRDSLALQAGLAADRASYLVGATVRLTGRIHYDTGNAPLTGAEAVVRVLSSGGTVVSETVKPLGDLLPGSDATVSAAWSTTGAAAGSYRAHLDVRRAGEVLAGAETLFDLTTRAVQLTGAVTVADTSPAWGPPLPVTYTVRNDGTAALSQVPVHLYVFDAGSQLLAQDQSLVDLAPGQAASRSVGFDTRSLGLGNRLLVLRAELPAASGTQMVTLSVVTLLIEDQTPPVVTLQTPQANAWMRNGREIAVLAEDTPAGLAAVESSLDGGAWQRLTLRDAVAGRFGLVLAGLTEGTHTLKARATDTAGNTAETPAVAFQVDLTPPQIRITGVQDDGSYATAVTPVVEIEEAHPATPSISLNGQPFISGTAVSEPGTYSLLVVAEDLAGNRAETQLTFTLDGAQQPELAAAKTGALAVDADQDGLPSPGDTLEYTVAIHSSGAAATDVELTDQIPAHTSVVSGSVVTTAGTVDTESPVHVLLGSLADGATATVTFRVQVDATVPAGLREIRNQGTVTSAELPAVLTDDPAVGGASDVTVTTITATPRLVGEKSATLAVDADNDGHPSPGDTLAYTVTVRNTGNTAASNVVLSDAVPAYTTLVAGSVTTTAGTVTAQSPVQVALGELAAGAAATVTFQVQVAATVPSGVRQVSNQGTVTSTELPALQTDDPDVGGTADPTVTALTASPRLTAEKTAVLFTDADEDGAASPGDTLLYQIVISNRGNTVATSVVLTDAIPAHTTLEPDSVQTSLGTVTATSPVTVNLGELATGTTATITFQVQVASSIPSGVSQISNQGTVASTELPSVLTDDPSVGGAADPTLTPITTAPRLTASKTSSVAVDADSDGHASPGDTLLYQITVSNIGNTSATSVVLTDAIPAHTALVSGSVQTSLGTVTATSPVTVDLGELAAGATATVTFQVQVASFIPAGVIQISNQGTVTSTDLPAVLTDDPSVGGAADPTVTPITTAPLLSASKTATPMVDADNNTVPSPGDTLAYTITIHNTGTTSATGVELTDQIPAHTSVVSGSVTTTAGTVDTESPVHVLLGSLADGATATVTFQVQVDATVPAGLREIRNQGTVTSAELPAVLTDDPTVGGASDVTVTTITATPRLVGEKSATLAVDADNDGHPSPGDTLAYTVTVRNTGNTAASNVALSDAVPAYTTLVSGSITTTAGTVTAQSPVQVALGELAAGATATVTFQVQVAATVPSGVRQVSNQGTVTSTELPALQTDDPAVGGTADPTVTALTASPRLTAEKTDVLFTDADENGAASPGDTLLYQIVISNRGNTSATGVVLSDAVPAHTTLVSGSVQTSLGTVTATSPVTVDLGELAAGATATVTFRVRVASSIPSGVSQISNQGTVTSAELPALLTDDPSVGGTADPTVTPITAAPCLTVSKTVSVAVDTNNDGHAGPGDTLLYQITVSNTGNTSATGVVLTDAIPALTALVSGSIQISQGTVTATTPVIVTLGELAAGATATITFRVKIVVLLPTGAIQISNQGTVTSAELSAVLTDDPSVGGTADATLIPITITPLLSIAGPVVSEGAGTAAFLATLSLPAGHPVTVEYATFNGTAKAGLDYTATAGLLTFAPGEVTKAISVPVLEDTLIEGVETFTVVLSNPVGAVPVNATGLGTILDNDLLFTPRVSISDVRVTEGDTGNLEARFSVDLSGPASDLVGVGYSTADGTAEAGKDYVAVSDAFAFAPGETHKTITVQVIGDTLLETDEKTFKVSLINPVGLTLDRWQATGVIVDNEACSGPNLLINPGAEQLPAADGSLPGWRKVEGAAWQRKSASPAPAEGTAYFFAGKVATAELAQDVSLLSYLPRILAGSQRFEVQASVRTFNESPSDTARLVVEYRDASNTLVLDAYDSGEIASPLEWRRISDARTVPVGTGWVRVRLISTRFNPGTDGAGDGYFDALSLRSLRASTLTLGDVSVYEIKTGTSAIFPVTLACPLDRDVSVHYATKNGTATAGTDYSAVAGTLTFPAGSSSRSIEVPILGDSVDEPHETFTVTLTDPTAAPDLVMLDPQALGVILNDDFCRRSPGYWKTHPNVWPAGSLVLGGAPYDTKKLRALLSYNGPDQATHLARQLTATKLNLLKGSDPAILPVVDAADAFLALFPPGSNPHGADNDRAEVLKDQLDQYNNQSCGN